MLSHASPLFLSREGRRLGMESADILASIEKVAC